jgi:peptidoglycan/LPS O-acetylase OafA/YrhL
MSAPYRPEIDGLRAVAVAAVVLFHAGVPGFANGFLGVDVFFVISGYLITGLIWTDLQAGRFSLAHFYERRARRILPALLLTCGLSLVAAWFIMAPPVLVEFAGHLAAALLFGSNIVYWLQAEYFATSAQLLPLLHTWSLAVEEQFYLVYPLALLAIGRASDQTKIALLAALAAASFVAAAVLTSRSVDASFYLLPTRLWELTAGALLAVGELRRRTAGSPDLSSMASAPWISAVGLGVIVASAMSVWPQGSHPGFATLGPVFATCAIIAFGSSRQSAGWLLSTRPVVAVGLISYSLYLFHQPVLAFARIWLARPLDAPETAAALMAAVAAAGLSWRYVEQPARRAQSLRLKPFAVAAAASTLLLGAASVATQLRDGFPGRMDGAVSAAFARIDAARVTRHAGIRMDRCHWQSIGAPVEVFVAQWNCLSDIGDFRPRILTVGDSMASDKAWAMRLAGFPAANLGGASCRVRSGPQVRPQCEQILAAAMALALNKQVDGIVLSSNWRGPIPPEEQQAIIDYWGPSGIPILVISGMPPFRDFRDRIARHVREGLPLADIGYDREELDAHLRSLAVFRAAGVPVIDASRLLCSENPCGAFVGSEPLMHDHVHLAPAGARRVGENLVRDPTWVAWIAQIQTVPRVAER